MNRKHAFMVAGTHSGCGKTTLTLALMAALREKGFCVQPFKVGPDFIDPGFHTRVAGLESRNLDGWMLGRDYNQNLFQQRLRHAHAAVVEGVMGLFDGYDGRSESGSSAEMAKWLDIPVVLVVDARSMARSAAALVQGFQNFDRDLRFAGVLFNRTGGVGHLRYLEEAMAGCREALPVLGGIPREEEIALPERHLGLVTAHETVVTDAWIRKLVQMVGEHVNLDGLMARCAWSPPSGPGSRGFHEQEQESLCVWTHEGIGAAPSPSMGSKDATAAGGLHPSREMPAGIERRDASHAPPPARSGSGTSKVPMAVARDAAFCFYYPDNLELLQSAGAAIQFFSPLAGETLPRGACGLYLGGGYPELFARQLSEQAAFLHDLAGAAARGMPIYAECGGLMVLGRFIETLEMERFPMAGLLPFGTRMLPRRKALGYTEVVLRERCLLGGPGTVVRGHEFHYSEIVDFEQTSAVKEVYDLRRRKHVPARREGYFAGSVLASYIHLHWGSAPGAAESLVAHCREFRHRIQGDRGS